MWVAGWVAVQCELQCVLQCVSVTEETCTTEQERCCGVLQCVAVSGCSVSCSVGNTVSDSQKRPAGKSKESVAVCCSVLQCVAVCCSVLQCVAECCGALPYGSQCVLQSVL